MAYSDELLMTYAKILKKCLIKMQKLEDDKKKHLNENIQKEIDICRNNLQATITFITK